MKKTLVVALIALVVAGVVWLLRGGELLEPDTGPQRNTTEHDGSVPTRVAGEAAPEQDAHGEETPNREEVTTPQAPSPTTATLRGRCVDPDGNPQAGCEARLHGWVANNERLDAYLKDHDRVDWTDPEIQVTQADGRFSFTFVPPPPHQFSLRIQASMRVELSGRWSELEPGTTKDLGDIVLTTGSRVTGQVVNTEGQPVERVYVAARLRVGTRRPRSEIRPRTPSRVRTAADGSFVLRQPVEFGSWKFSVQGLHKVSPETVEVPNGQLDTFVEIVVRRQEEVETISGTVVDESGRSIPRVEVIPWPRTSFPTARTDRDGSFTLVRREGYSGQPTQVRLHREGYEYFLSKVRYPWGSSGLRFVMQCALAIEVRVTDAESGAPIEDFGLRIFPKPGRRGLVTVDPRVHNRGHHPGGLAVLEGIVRGAHLLVVEPKGNAWLSSGFVPVEVTDGGAPRVEVYLSQPVSRTLIVRHGNHSPVAGSAVELLAPLNDEPVRLQTLSMTMDQFVDHYGQGSALLLHEGSTDDEGQFELVGPGGVPLAVRLLGPGHQPLVERNVDLSAAKPLIVTVPAGATLVGRVEPLRLLRQLRREAGIPETGPVDSRQRRRLPGIALRRQRDGERAESFPAEGKAHLAEDGHFRIACIPPGTWKVQLVSSRTSSARSFSTGQTTVTTVPRLAEGETREIELQLHHLLRSDLSGRVFHNGEPVAHTRLNIEVTFGADASGRPQRTSLYTETDAEGHFEILAQPGNYLPQLQVRDPDTSTWTTLPADSAVQVVAGESAEAVFHISSGPLRVRVLDADSRPVPGVRLQWSTAGDTFHYFPFTDAEGRAGLAHIPAGTVTLSVAPKRLLTEEARNAFLEAHSGDPGAWSRAMIEAGSVQVTAGGQPEELEIRLPPEAGY